MNLEEIKNNVIKIVTEICKNDPVGPIITTHLDELCDLNMDSITFVYLIVELESCFNITVPDDFLVVDNFSNISKIVKFVEKQLSDNKNTI